MDRIDFAEAIEIGKAAQEIGGFGDSAALPAIARLAEMIGIDRRRNGPNLVAETLQDEIPRLMADMAVNDLTLQGKDDHRPFDLIGSVSPYPSA